MDVIKRDGRTAAFDSNKIYSAVMKAMQYGSGIIDSSVAHSIASDIGERASKSGKPFSVPEIEHMVFHQLIEHGHELTAKAYEAYRSVQEYKRNRTQLDTDIEQIIDGTNIEALDENSNKNTHVASTQRDLIAGEYSRDYTKRNLLPANILYAHNEGIIHFHDADYFLQHIFNCALVDLDDMLQNGTVINRKMIEKPKSFRVACTVATQIVQQVSNGQYGGQTISISHLAPFVKVSYEKWKQRTREDLERTGVIDMLKDPGAYIEAVATQRLKEEIKDGVQTMQYQINTFNTANGQSPFLSIFIYLNEKPEYIKETAMIAEEMFRQRIQGLKNEAGIYVTPSFPKLLYVTDENNIHEDSEYFYLTKLAAECTSKRMVPDYISAKIMRKEYDGEVFPCMGCRSFLGSYKDPATGKYKWYGRFNQGVVTINLADAGLSAKGDTDTFWNILDERLNLCYQALMIRHNRLKDTTTEISPIHWKYGAISRTESSNFNDMLYDGYSSISLGYAGLYECVLALTGESHTTEKGQELALKIMNHLAGKTKQWREETNIGFSLYGTPLESTTYKFAKCLKKRFGVIEGITDKDYVTNSYHVNVSEHIGAYEKLKFESQFQSISAGGCISYIESANVSYNPDALIPVIQYMYENIRYAEINGKFDCCQACGYEGEMQIDDNMEWYCPVCGNRDKRKMNVARRTCGLTKNGSR